MKTIIITAMLAGAGWYGNLLYQQNELPFLDNLLASSSMTTKCTTPDDRVIYGDVPVGNTCAKLEAVSGALTVLEGKPFSADESDAFIPTPRYSNFQCDGRVYCSQMKSCEEATLFLKNCPGVKMDGNNDGVPCERQWCH